jgi:hypothetical protein
LIRKNTCLVSLWSFQGARGYDTHEKIRRHDGGLSKLNSVPAVSLWRDIRPETSTTRSTLFQASSDLGRLEEPSSRRLTVALVGEAGEAYR